MTGPTEDLSPRLIKPGSCLGCGHDPHGRVCGKKIRTGKGTAAPCSCPRGDLT